MLPTLHCEKEMTMNSLDYQSTRFARSAGESWVRPTYASAIEIYREPAGVFSKVWPTFITIVGVGYVVGAVLMIAKFI
jgi:hypothetical protein